MRSKGLTRFLLACLGLVASGYAAAQGVRISELHYDNVGTDAGEAVEISGPAGTARSTTPAAAPTAPRAY